MATGTQRGRLRLVEARPEPAEEGQVAVAAAGAAVGAASATPLPVPAARLPRAVSLAGLAALPDAQLVALGCKGDTQALELLYRRHVAFAIHLATRIEGSARDVEDIAHDAFLRAFERLNDLADRSAFRAWLGSIVVHAVRSRMRRGRLLSALGMGKGSEPVDLDAVASPDASPHIRAQIAQIYALLRTLPTDDRIAWTLRAVEGHDLESVARMTRCSLATVKRRITRAQRFLDEHFVDPHAGDEPAAAEEPRVAGPVSDYRGVREPGASGRASSPSHPPDPTGKELRVPGPRADDVEEEEGAS